MTDFQEYPLAIYKGGEVGDDFRIVDDAEAEAEHAKDGYIRHDAEPKARRGRPPKADTGE